MITSGYFIGQIIDELTAISFKVEMRGKCHLFDLNTYLENFFKTILNTTLGYNLKNLNDERINAPGIDLVDESEKKAFQITSMKTSDKINDTLRAATDYKGAYEVIVLIVGKKQSSYTPDDSLWNDFNFTKNNIWDITDIFKKCMSLEIDKLQELHTFIMKEAVKVKIELEIISADDSQYQTSFNDYLELIPTPKFNGVLSYYTSIKADIDNSENDIKNAFEFFIETLQKLPRITRQFYAYLLKTGEWKDTDKQINYGILIRRACRFPDIDGEIFLLKEAGLCDMIDADEDNKFHRIKTIDLHTHDYFISCFVQYIEKNKLDFEKIIVSLDFSDFDSIQNQPTN